MYGLVFGFLSFIVYGDRVLLSSTVWPGTPSVDHAITCGNPPASAAGVLGLPECATMPDYLLSLEDSPGRTGIELGEGRFSTLLGSQTLYESAESCGIPCHQVYTVLLEISV